MEGVVSGCAAADDVLRALRLAMAGSEQVELVHWIWWYGVRSGRLGLGLGPRLRLFWLRLGEQVGQAREVFAQSLEHPRGIQSPASTPRVGRAGG